MLSSPQVIVVGAGFGGIAQTIELLRAGITDITVLDHAPQVGGTWFHNTYPGAACDVPSQLYSFSFAQRTDWTHLCSPQDEILRYISDVAREFGVTERFTGGVDVVSTDFDDTTRRWTVTAADGRTWEGDVVVLATGQLHQPAFPGIPGREDFTGHSFHSAQWDHEHVLDGKRVAVVGTGASAVQFVPIVARQAQRLVVFQRTGNWFMPRRNRPYPRAIKAAIAAVPGVQKLRRAYWFNVGETLTASIRHPGTLGRLYAIASRGFMRRQLKDPEVRAKVWPDYTFGCKRVIFSSRYLPALQKPNVHVETSAIARMTADTIVCADGSEHPVDTIIYATGFKTVDFMFPMEVHGRGGRSLRDTWAGGAHAHLGMSVPGFPNLFVLYGPNTNTSGGSIITYLESQAAYVRQAVQHARAVGAPIEVREEVEAASDKALQARFDGTAWTECNSWYKTSDGRVVTNWPGYMREFIKATRTFEPAEFAAVPAAEPAAVA